MAVYLELSSSKVQCSEKYYNACPQTVSVQIKDTEEYTILYGLGRDGMHYAMDYGVNKKQEMIPLQ